MTVDINDIETADEGEKATVRYQSVHHPDAEKTEVEGEILDVFDGLVAIEDEEGRVLEVEGNVVRKSHDADGRYVDNKLGTDPEVVVHRLYEVYVDATAIKTVRAESEEEAREKAIKMTDHGEMYDSTDKNAASRKNG